MGREPCAQPGGVGADLVEEHPQSVLALFLALHRALVLRRDHHDVVLRSL